MPASKTSVALLYGCNVFNVVVMFGIFGLINNSYGDIPQSGSGIVPAAVANNPTEANAPGDGSNTGVAVNRRNSVIFKKRNATYKKPADCRSNGTCVAQQNVALPRRPQRPVGIASGVGVSANNKGQAAKVKVKVPF